MGAAGVEGRGAAVFPFLFLGCLARGAPSAAVARDSPPGGGGVASVAVGGSGGLASSVEVRSGGSSSNQGADFTGSPKGDCAGGGPAGGAAVPRVAPRDAEREPMRSITTW